MKLFTQPLQWNVWNCGDVGKRKCDFTGVRGAEEEKQHCNTTMQAKHSGHRPVGLNQCQVGLYFSTYF